MTKKEKWHLQLPRCLNEHNEPDDVQQDWKLQFVRTRANVNNQEVYTMDRHKLQHEEREMTNSPYCMSEENKPDDVQQDCREE